MTVLGTMGDIQLSGLPVYGLVYIATNTVNGKVYVGQTTGTLERRAKEHWWATTAPSTRKQTTFHKALRKYGREAFEWTSSTTASCAKSLDGAEQFYIRLYGAHCSIGQGYNETWGGGGTTGYTVSAETRAKISKANMGSKHPNRKKQSSPSWRKGRKFGKAHNSIVISQESLKADIVGGLELRDIAAKYGCSNGPPRRLIKQYWNATLYQVRRELTGDSRTIKTRQAISTTLSNPGHPAYGRKHTDKSKREQSEIRRLWWEQQKLRGASDEKRI